jgi:hypothetical protein
LPTTTRRYDVVCGARRDEIGIGRERGAARCSGPEENLIDPQRRRLQDNGRAVGQRPFGDAGAGAFSGLDDGAARGRRIHQLLPRGSVDVCLETLGRRGADRCRELLLVRQHDSGRFWRGHDDQLVLIREPVCCQRIDLRERDRRNEAPMEREFLPDRGQRLGLQEVARVLVSAALRLAIGTLFDHALRAGHVLLLRALEFRRREAETSDPLELCD